MDLEGAPHIGRTQSFPDRQALRYAGQALRHEYRHRQRDRPHGGDRRRAFETGLIADIEDVTTQSVARALSMWSIVAARDIAREHAEILWALRNEPRMSAIYADTLARAVELSSRGILI